jgi:hypothetical protein
MPNLGLCLGNFRYVKKLVDIRKIGGLGKLAVELVDIKNIEGLGKLAVS